MCSFFCPFDEKTCSCNWRKFILYHFSQLFSFSFASADSVSCQLAHSSDLQMWTSARLETWTQPERLLWELGLWMHKWLFRSRELWLNVHVELFIEESVVTTYSLLFIAQECCTWWVAAVPSVKFCGKSVFISWRRTFMANKNPKHTQIFLLLTLHGTTKTSHYWRMKTAWINIWKLAMLLQCDCLAWRHTRSCEKDLQCFLSNSTNNLLLKYD